MKAPALCPGSVHVWELAQSANYRNKLANEAESLLSDAERRRLASLPRPAARSRFLFGRVLLRRTLGLYLDKNPARLSITESANGKPQSHVASRHGIAFSLSHAAGGSVLAVGRAAAIGIDIEPLSRSAAAFRISQHFFSDDEAEQIRAAGGAGQTRALMIWSLKECVLKAKGDTVWDGLDRLPMAIEGARISCPALIEGKRFKWDLVGGKYRQRHVVALARKMPTGSDYGALTIRCFRLDESVCGTADFIPEFATDATLQPG